MDKIANRQSLAFSERNQLSQPFRSSMWNECQASEGQSRDSNRGTTNAVSVRTNFCVFEGYDRQRTLAIRIAAITLASDSAITIARFRPSKLALKIDSPLCLAAIFDSQLPSPELSPPKLPLPHKRGFFLLFKNCPCGEGNCAAAERLKLSCGKFCLAASTRGLSGPSGWLFATFAWKRFFALFCAFLLFYVLAFALFCAHLRSFAFVCMFLCPTAFRTTAVGNFRGPPQMFFFLLCSISFIVLPFFPMQIGVLHISPLSVRGVAHTLFGVDFRFFFADCPLKLCKFSVR